MAIPSLPAEGSPDWYAWAQGIHTAAANVDAGAFGAARDATHFAGFGAPQHENGATYTYPTPLNFGAVNSPPTARAAASKGVDIVAHWYNDFGLDSTALAAGESNGSYVWYDWRWNFPTNTGNGTTTLGYDQSRHPLQGFYKGDDPDVLGWQCYWMAEAGVSAVSIVQPSGFTTADWDNPANGNYWVNRLFTATPNFQALQYVLWMKCDGTSGAVEAQNDELVDAYATYPGGMTYTDNGEVFAVIYAWELEQLRGVYDGFSGQAGTVTHLKGLAAKFQAIGYAGVLILARSGGLVTASPDPTLRGAGVIVLDAGYETLYGTYASYAAYAATAAFPADPTTVVNVVTSSDTMYPHPSTFNTPGSTPELFQQALHRAVSSVARNGQKRIVTIYNVSEWAEGGPGLIPNKRDGFGYLDAIASVPALAPSEVGAAALVVSASAAVMEQRKEWSRWKATGVTIGASTFVDVDVTGFTAFYSFLDSPGDYTFTTSLEALGTMPSLPLSALVRPDFGSQRIYVRVYNSNATSVSSISVSLEVRHRP